MISAYPIGNAGDAARYHDKAFARDGEKQAADNYYVNEQATARWQGAGAEVLGLTDEPVTREQFIAFLEGKLPNPETGLVQDLADNAKGDQRQAGFDFTVAPSKSVSIVALVGGDERIVAAHQAANQEAMGWLEKHASIVRVRHDGEISRRQAGNLLYATVVHETNRENEPHLHNHNVIVSAVYDAQSGKWRSLTNDQLLVLRAQADVVYKSELAHGLTKAGYQLDYADNGVDFEIAGITTAQIQGYAKRTQHINAALRARGIDPATASYEARQAATLDSRASKHDVGREALQQDWAATARGVGLDLQEVVGRARENALEAAQTNALPAAGQQQALGPQEQREALRAVSFAIEHLAEREQTFKVPDLETTALRFAPATRIGHVEWAVTEHRKNGLLIDRGTNDGGLELVTTAKGLRDERLLVSHIVAGFDKGSAIVNDPHAFSAAVRAFEHAKTQETGQAYKLSSEQVDAARAVLMHPDQYQGIQGEAGTGKTAALAMVRGVAQAKGWQVVGVATSASAAQELGEASGIPSQTVASFFVQRDNAILATRLQIQSLRVAISTQRASRSSSGAPALVESTRLHVKSRDQDFGASRYTFDHRRGDVFKSQNNVTNLLGNFFADFAETRRDSAMASAANAETIGQRLQAKARVLGVRAAEQAGYLFTRFESVGIAEATAARNALYLQRDPTRSPELQELARKEAELANLQRFGNVQGTRTLLVMDESSMTGASDATRISELAQAIGARVVFQGDIKQHGSVPAGRAFAQAQDAGMHTAMLSETRRFDKATPQVKSAIELMREGLYSSAIASLDTTNVQPESLASTVATRYLDNLRELEAEGMDAPRVGIVALTNADRKEINLAVHDHLTEHGVVAKESFTKQHLDDPKLTDAQKLLVRELRAAKVDHLQFRRGYKEIGIKRDDLVRVVRFDATNNRIIVETPNGQRITINPQRHDFFTPVKMESRSYATGDRVEARANIKYRDKAIPRTANGTRGVVTAIDASGATVRWHGGAETRLDNKALRVVDHAYAHTTYKEQGATNDRQIIAVSDTGAKIFNREAAYVAASRAKDNTEIVTTDSTRMLKNAGRDVSKSTALDPDGLAEAILGYRPSASVERSVSKAPAAVDLEMQRFERAILANRPAAPQREVEPVKPRELDDLAAAGRGNRAPIDSVRDVSKSTAADLDMQRFERAILANRPAAPQRAVEQVKPINQIKQRDQDHGLSL